MPIPYDGQGSGARPFEIGTQHIDESSEDGQVQSKIDSEKVSS